MLTSAVVVAFGSTSRAFTVTFFLLPTFCTLEELLVARVVVAMRSSVLVAVVVAKRVCGIYEGIEIAPVPPP